MKTNNVNPNPKGGMNMKTLSIINLKTLLTCMLGLAILAGTVGTVMAQEVLPFKKQKSGTIAGYTMADSTYDPAKPKSHLPADAPNIVIILIDDAGPGSPSAFGGEVQTPNLAKL